MTALRNIIDTYNVIEKHNIQGWEAVNSCIIIVPDDEYNRLYNEVVNKEYVRNLRTHSQFAREHRYH